MKPQRFGDVSIHVSADYRATVVIKGGAHEPPEFTKTEGRILQVLLKRPGMVCTARMFANALYPGMSARKLPNQKLIDVKMYDIRGKLRSAGCPSTIVSVWGRGHRFGDAAPRVTSVLVPEELRDCERWVPSRKIQLLNLIRESKSQREVLAHFTDLSIEELTEWKELLHTETEQPLRSTRAWRMI